jgi:RHS repeat-associated protein
MDSLSAWQLTGATGMGTRTWLRVYARSVVYVVVSAPIFLAWSGNCLAETTYDIPYFYQEAGNQDPPVTHVFNAKQAAIDSAEEYLAANFPATNPKVCPIEASVPDNGDSASQGLVVTVEYGPSSDPAHFSCPSNKVDVKETAYQHDPNKNSGDTGNCNGGNGVSGGDAYIMCAGSSMGGDPINLATGNKYQQETDFEATPWLAFRRFYNSQTSIRGDTLGPQWRHSFDRSLAFVNSLPNGNGSTNIMALRPDGNGITFTPTTNGVWATDPNQPDRLTQDSSGFTLFVAGPDQFERYSTSGVLQTITDKSGQVTTLSYSGSLLDTVTDPYGRVLHFAYDGSGLLQTVTLPDAGTLTYSYTNGLLSSVQYPDGKTRGYKYNESSLTGGTNLPNNLTGVVDENGVRYESTSYDALGQAKSSSKAGGAETVTLTGVGTGSVAMVSPFGGTMQYSFQDDGFGGLQLASTSVPCHASWCNQSWAIISYDANGYPRSYQDFMLNETDVTNNSVGLETTRVEGVGLAELGIQRTINTTWDVNLRNPLSRVVLDSNNNPVLQTAWAYNSRGQVTAQCLVDPTVSGASGYVCGSAAQAPTGVRQARYTYCDTVDGTQCPIIGLLLSVDGPRTDVSDVTTYTYYLSTDESACNVAGGACHHAGDVFKVTDALGHATTYAGYDRAGRVTRQIDANGVITDLTYTPRGWLQTRSVGGALTTVTYTAYGEVASVTDADSAIVTYTYDDAHRLTDITDALGNHIHYGLDVAGHRTDEAIYPVGSSTPSRHLSRTFNNLGQLATVIDGLNHVVFNASTDSSNGPVDSYDLNGNLQFSTDGLGVQQLRSYDGLNRLNGITDDEGGQSTSTEFASTSIGYDLLDRRNSFTPAGVFTPTTTSYDALDNVTATQSPDKGATAATFDAAGNRLTRTDAKGITSTTTYDAVNRPLLVSYTDSSLNVVYHYDEADGTTGCTNSYAIGRLTRVVESAVTTIYCYDAHGNVIQKRQIQGSQSDATSYSYSAADRLTSVTNPDGLVTVYSRNPLGQITQVTVTLPGGAATVAVSNVTYLPFGPVSGYILGNGQAITRNYDLNYRVTDVTSPALNLHFSRDAMGNVTALLNAGGGPTIESYSYDPLYRLLGVNDATGSSLEAFTYDQAGNRLSKAGSGQAVGTYSYFAFPSSHLTSVGSAARTYDANGNTTGNSASGETFGYGYNGRNRMMILQRNQQTVATYTYNVLGQRVSKVATMPQAVNSRFVYNEDGQLLAEYGTSNRDYIWVDGLPVAVVDAVGSVDTVSYVHADGLNTPRAVTDGSGVVQWQWAYQDNPFGEKLPTSSAGFVFNLRYPGQYFDSESGLLNNGYRDYDAATGRYLQGDPAGLDAGPSLYAYVTDNPLAYFDQWGLAGRKTKVYLGSRPTQWGPKHEYLVMQSNDGTGQIYVLRAAPSGVQDISLLDGALDKVEMDPDTGAAKYINASLELSTWKGSDFGAEGAAAEDASIEVIDADLTEVVAWANTVVQNFNELKIPYQAKTVNSNSFASNAYNGLVGHWAPNQGDYYGGLTKLQFDFAFHCHK